MKQYILSTILFASLMLCGNAQALDKYSMDMCVEYAQKAAVVQVDRQNDVSVVEAMQKYASGVDTDLMQRIVSEAYDVPYFTQQQVKERAVKDFATYIFNSCFKELTVADQQRGSNGTN